MGVHFLNKTVSHFVSFAPASELYFYFGGYFSGTLSFATVLRFVIYFSIKLVPLGVLLPICFKSMMHMGKFTLIIVTISFALELCQYIFKVGNVYIDDIFLSVVGALIAYLLTRKIINIRNSKLSRDNSLIVPLM